LPRDLTVTDSTSGVAKSVGAGITAKLHRSAEVLREEGLSRFFELAALSLSEPIRTLYLRAAVSADARRALAKLRAGKRGRGLFIDCGSNVGQAYTYFSSYYRPDHYDYILIEPNAKCLPFLEAFRKNRGANIEIIAKAASTSNGFATLFGPPSTENQPTYQGRSLIAEHNSSFYDNHDATADVVETFSLAQLILSKSSAYDLIVLKMDVEGAEYDILKDILRADAHREIFAAYIEFHSLYMKQPERTKTRELERAIKTALVGQNVTFREWI
jgi:FkbM family methyltransferase